MKSFKVIPVIDILNSTAVHAKKGERIDYKPLNYEIFQSSNPIDIVRTIQQKFHLYEIYIADLDSILRGIPNLKILKEILKISKIEIYLDPGIANLEDIFKFKEIKLKSLILGLETINNLQVINQGLELLSPKNIIVSIDMYKEQILTKAKDIKKYTPIDIIKELEAFGIERIILLDLFRVGQKIGGIPTIYLDILRDFNGDIFVGGGIKNLEDILDYKDHNFSGVLIATALYDGTINIEKLRNLK